MTKIPGGPRGGVSFVFVCGLLLLGFQGACSHGLLGALGGDSSGARAAALAAEAGLVPVRIPTPQFRLQAWQRPATARLLVVYIEGDGRAWINRHRPSRDPTPRRLLMLRLAIQDPAPALAYLARPCQFTLPEDDAACALRYWTNARFAPEVLRAMSLALDHLKLQAEASRLLLIGYSGGATVAALLSAQREDVAALVTLAGVLDHDAWTHYHGVTPLYASENPLSVIDRLSVIPQWHLVGTEDDIAPPELLQAFLARFPQNRPVHLLSVPGATHYKGWIEAWFDRRRRIAWVFREETSADPKSEAASP